MKEFENIKSIIRLGQYQALHAANYYLLRVYWQVGGYISYQLTNKNWGAKIVDNLAEWLKADDIALKGFDRRSLYRMKEFYETWSNEEIVLIALKTLPKQITSDGSANFQNIDYKDVVIVESANPQLQHNTNIIENEIVGSVTPQLADMPAFLQKITWTHHLELLKGTTSNEEKIFYIGLAIKEKYTVRELRRQIESSLFERQMLSKSMFLAAHPQKDKINTIFKDTYIAEFLSLPEPHSEKELHKQLIAKMKDFILELGKDFIFIASEFKVQVGTHDYFIDLLFYHRDLQCLVAFELKTKAFKPEHLDKMDFYLDALDRDVKKQAENPSIGILLCKTKDTEVVEYALSRSLSPAMVAKYETQMPDKKLLQQKIHELAESGYFGFK